MKSNKNKLKNKLNKTAKKEALHTIRLFVLKVATILLFAVFAYVISVVKMDGEGLILLAGSGLISLHFLLIYIYYSLTEKLMLSQKNEQELQADDEKGNQD